MHIKEPSGLYSIEEESRMSLSIAPSSECYTETNQREVKLIKFFFKEG